MVLGTKTKVLGLLLRMAALSVLAVILFGSQNAHAATGINQNIQFQGRLLNSQGAIVPDGYYNIEFKIYQGGDGQSVGDTTGTPAGTLLWTEDYINDTSQYPTTYGVQVVNGFFSVDLGSICPFSGGSCEGNTNTAINWNQDTLWLSMNIAGTSTTCTPFSACSPDGEMVPMQRMTSSPYSLNSGELNGLASSQFVQLGQGVQTDASTNASIFINKTGAADLMDLQAAGSDALIVGNTGDITFGSNVTTHSISVATAAASTAGVSLSVTAGAAGSGTTALAGGNLTLSGGTGGGTNGNGGNVSIDAGQANGTGTNGNVNIGTQYANAIAIGNTTGTSGTSISVGAGNFQLNGVGSSTYSVGSSTTTGTIGIGGTGQTGALTLQAEGISESINGSTTAPSVVVQSSTNSASTLQIENQAGNKVFGVDTSANRAVLGQASALNGTLVFNNSSNANSVTLNSTSAYSSYSLTLPTLAPSPGLCLETSTSSSTQLVFVSCSNNNASISEVQEWDTSSINSLTINPTNVGDELILTTSIQTSGVSVSSITGGGVSAWTKVVTSSGNGTVDRVEMWVGTVSAVGNSIVTVNYSGSPGTEEIAVTEFTAAGVNGATNWGIDASGSLLNTTASTSVTYPSIDSTNSDELYVGYAQVQNPPATSGTTTGFSYIITSVQHNVITYNLSTNASTNYQPTANQNSAGESNTLGILMTAFVSSSAINNSTSLQKANYYVQASSTGSVAGVLQAANSGQGDIMDLRNSGGTNVATFGYAGAVTFENSANSPTAFLVQNSNAQTVLGVNTSTGQINVGSALGVNGTLNFYDSTDSNSITLASPASIATSYSLSLPSNAPSTGLCLETGPTNAAQLVFTSCAQQVSTATISYVQQWNAHGTDITTLSISPSSVGDLLLFYADENGGTSGYITGISGGGVGKWSKITSYTAGGPKGATVEMWRGVVVTSGASTVTVTYNATPNANELAVMEYTIGSSTGTWDVDTSGTLTGSGTTVDYPSLTPANSSELYSGYAVGAGTMTAGTTTGYTYVATGLGYYLAYNPSVNGGVATQPTATQTGSNSAYYSISAVIAAYNTSSVIADSTSTQQANFNVQAAKSGTVAGVLQAAASSTADIFDARNANGYNVAAVTNNGITLGTSQSVAGSLTFSDTTDTNTITIASPSSIASTYTLSLPSTTPVGGMCLSTSQSNADQLIYSNCAAQVTSAPISYVSEWDANGNNLTTLSVSPVNVGDLMLLWVSAGNNSAVSSLSGGGVTSWSLVTYINGASGVNRLELWRGVVTTAGASTITLAYAGGNGGNGVELAATEFTMNSTSGTWIVDNSGTLATATGTVVYYPSLTPSYQKDLYVGYAVGSSTMSAGTTTGYTYLPTGLGRYFAYDTSVSGTQQPSANQATSGTSTSIGALISAFNSESVIANLTTIQQANIYLQAASTGSVAAKFQAATGSPSDIVDILDGSGTLVDSFGSTGNFLVRPSTNSASAFLVQNLSNVTVLSVDTNTLQVSIGAGATGEATPSLLVLDNQTGSSNDPTEVNGAMYYNATTKTFRCGVAGAWESCSGLLYANPTTSGSVNNCTNNCAAFSTSAAVPAGYCQAGRAIKIQTDGFYSTGSTSSGLQFGIYYGTSATTASSDTLIGSLTPAVTTTSATNYYYQINYAIICFSTTSLEAEGTLSVQTTGASTSSMSILPIASTSTTTAVTSSAANFYIFPLWSVASTSNTANVTQMIVNGY